MSRGVEESIFTRTEAYADNLRVQLKYDGRTRLMARRTDCGQNVRLYNRMPIEKSAMYWVKVLISIKLNFQRHDQIVSCRLIVLLP